MLKSKPRRPALRPRRSNLDGGRRRALPVCAAALAALGAFAPGAASAAVATQKFCGFWLNGLPPKEWEAPTKANLRDLRNAHNMMNAAKRFDEYQRRPAGMGTYTGFILWGYENTLGFVPLYFVPSNVSPDDC